MSLTSYRNVTIYGANVFAGCTALEEIALAGIDPEWLSQGATAESLPNIGAGMFSGCASLQSVTIPAAVTNVGQGAFSGCEALRKVHYGATLSEWNQISIGENNEPLTGARLYTTDPPLTGSCGDDAAWTLHYDGLLEISGSGEVTSAPWLEAGVTIRELRVADGISAIPAGAFSGCAALEQIIFSGTVPALDEQAFAGVTATAWCAVGAAHSGCGLSWRSYCALDDEGAVIEHTLRHVEAKPASCTEEGWSEYYQCEVCAAKFYDANGINEAGYDSIHLPPMGHRWVEPSFEWHIDEASCSCVAQFPCMRCEETMPVEADVVETVVTEPTCTEAGEAACTATARVSNDTDPETFEPIWDEYTDATTRVIPALGHEEEIIEAAVEATCTKAGRTATIICKRCDEILQDGEMIPATGHTDAVTIEAVEADCTEEGHTAEHRCAVCGVLLEASETIPALGHEEVVTLEAQAPTCTEDGWTREIQCSRCQKVLSASQIVPALGHTPVTDEAVAPTAHESGRTEGSHCRACGEVLEAQQEIPALYSWEGTTITGYNGSDCEITLPEDATALSDTAFMNNTSLTSITIPANITQVGSKTFRGCTSLEVLRIEGDLTGIAALTLYSANPKIYVAADTEAARVLSVRGRSFTIPDGWTLRYDLLDASAEPTGVTIYGCEGDAAELQIPETIGNVPVTDIAADAFTYRANLTKLVIPDSVTSIDSGAFTGSEQLAIWSSEESYAHTFALDNGIAWVCWPLVMEEADFVLPAKLKTIGEEAFAGIAAQVVQLPETVTSIGKRAFADSAALRQIYIPAECTSIAEDAFEGCAENLTIFGSSGSAAESYAAGHGYAFGVK